AQARRLAPTATATLRAAGEVAYFTGAQPSEARQNLREALRRDSSDTELLRLVGHLEMTLGDPAAALALGERAAMIDPRDPETSNSLVTWYAWVGRFAVAGTYE